MTLTVERAVREFKYNGMALQDPGPGMSAEDVKTFYANLYPELNNAAIEGPEHEGAKMVYEFRRAVGTKGVEETKDLPTAQWAIVEIFGHARIAGRISEQTIGGCAFVRVDVPDVPGQKGYTKLFGNGAIYAITFVDEPIATAAAESIRARPVQPYDVSALKYDAVARQLEDARDRERYS